MHAWVDGADEVHAGAEDVFRIQRGQDIVAKGRIAAGGVDGGGVLIEGSVGLSDAEVMGRPVDFGDGWVWEALLDFLRIERCRRHDVGMAGWWGGFWRLCWLGLHRHEQWISSNDCQ